MTIRWFARIFAVFLLAAPLLAESPTAKLEKFGNTPLVFEPNYGQVDSSVRFMSRGDRYGLFLTESEAIVSLVGPKSALVRMQLVGQSAHTQISGSDLQPGESHYFKGSDKLKWQQSVPQFLKVYYRGVYPGIDLTYYGNQRQLEYDFTVSPHANPAAIALKFSGTKNIEIGDDGDLILHTLAGEIRHRRPHIFQNRDGAEEVIEGKFVLLGGGKVGFKIGAYDESLPLVIDPKFVYSSYFGGGGPNGDIGIDVKVDALGSAYVTGYTSSADFFTRNLSSTAPGGGNLDAFLLKVDPTGSTVTSAVYYGGTGDDEGHRIALDASGNIFITGYTTSSDFPIVNGFQTKIGGRKDAYLIKIDNSASQILYSTYLGGSKDEQPFGLSIDGSGNAVIAGETMSSEKENFPVVNAIRPKFGGGSADGFVSKISPSGTVVYTTYLGGIGNDRAYDVTTDVDGNAYVVGFTSSVDFPVAKALYAHYQGGSEDAFFTKLSPNGSQFLISTYFGGVGTEEAIRVALDSGGNILVAGLSNSPNLPVKNAIQPFLSAASDIFLVKFLADDSDLIFSTYVGSDGIESPPGLAVDSRDNIFVAGFTTSFSFPVVNGINIGTSGGGLHGERDGYVMKLTSNGAILFSTYVGGSDSDGAVGLTVDKAGNAYVTGYTFSTNFPTESPFQPEIAGAADGFLLKINSDDVAITTPMVIPANGATTLATVGSSNSIGFLQATFNGLTGSPAPAGFALLDLRQGGAETGEAALPLLPFIHEGVVYVNETGTEATNIAIVNPSDEAVQMYFFMADNQGSTSHYGGVLIPPRSSFAQPVTAAPFQLPAGSVGTLRFSATIPVAAIAFRTFVETSGSVLFTYLPIAKPTEFETRIKVVPHFAADGEWNSQFILVNPTDFQMTGQIQFFSNGPNTGDPTQSSTPIEIVLDRGNFTSVPYSLAPGATDFFSTGGQPLPASGFALVIPDPGTYTPAASVLMNRTTVGVITLRATEEATVPTSDFRLFEEFTGDFENFEGHSAATAFAISNPNPVPSTITMTLINMDGTPQGLSSTFTLPAMGHIATFLHRLPEFATLPNPFRGTVVVHASGPGVVAIGLRAGYSENGNIVGTMTGPLKEHPGQGSTAIFPHILDGGGYATQFFLFGDPSGQGLAGTLSFRDENGVDRPLAIGTGN